MINIQNYTMYWHQYRWSTSLAYSTILDVLRVLDYYLKYFIIRSILEYISLVSELLTHYLWEPNLIKRIQHLCLFSLALHS